MTKLIHPIISPYCHLILTRFISKKTLVGSCERSAIMRTSIYPIIIVFNELADNASPTLVIA